jgi:hypothetical protein
MKGQKFAIIFILVSFVFQVTFPVRIYAQEGETEATTSASLNVDSNPLPEPQVEISGNSLLLFDQDDTADSSRVREPLEIRRTPKKNLQVTEVVEVEFSHVYDREVQVELTDRRGNRLPIKVERTRTGEDMTIKLTPPDSFSPGVFRMTITDSEGNSYSQDFSWGVLALNTNKSIYIPDEIVSVDMAVLDEYGAMVCDALVSLEVRSPSGKIARFESKEGTVKVSPKCAVRDVVFEPDFYSKYQIGTELGVYSLRLEAKTKNGIYDIQDSFEVRQNIPFDIERISSTRIYPLKEYEMKIKLTANEAFIGEVIEYVPYNFLLSHPATSGVRAYDNVSSQSTLAGNSQVLGISDIDISNPFMGNFSQTLGFGEIPESEDLQDHYKSYGLASHDAIDFALPEGTPVLSAAKGTVAQSGESALGLSAIIEHNWGNSFYGHLSRVDVTVGEKIERGQQIGLSGSTGKSTGPHLHFAIRPKGFDPDNGYLGKVDPEPYILGGDGRVLSATSVVFDHKKISWNVDLKAGETITLGYKYDAPDISPQFYLTGPLSLHRSSNVSKNIELENVPLDRPDQATNSTSSHSASIANNGTGESQEISVQAQQNDKLSVFTELRRWQIAADADVTIDGTADTSGSDHLSAPRMVFITDKIGYMFYNDSTGSAGFAKTYDGGTTWSGFTQITSQTDTEGMSIWFDQWTSGITGGYIHITFLDRGDDDLWYERVDTTNNDAQLGEVSINGGSTQIAGTREGAVVTRGTDGILYVAEFDSDGGAKILNCSASCGTAGNWSEVAGSGIDDADPLKLVPLSRGSIMVVRHDQTAEDIESNIWNGSSWTGFTDIDTSAPASGTYFNTATVVVRRSTNVVYLSYISSAGTNDTAELRTAVYDGSSWTAKTDVLDAADIGAAETLISASLAVDEESGDVYVVYIRGDAANNTTNVYYKKSTDRMVSWGSEVQLNTSNSNLDNEVAWSNIVSSDRIYFVYLNNAMIDDGLFGASVSDLTPPADLSRYMRHGMWFDSSGRKREFTF